MFTKKVDKRSNEDMWKYLKEHFTYDTLNSWNGLKSIAHNVKIYNLKLPDTDTAFKVIETDEFWFDVDNKIRLWQTKHSGYRIMFNGRSSGYVVLCASENNCNVLPYEITNYDTFEEYVEHMTGDYGGYSKSDINYELKVLVELVQDFDEFVDEIRLYLIDFCNHYQNLKPLKCTQCGEELEDMFFYKALDNFIMTKYFDDDDDNCFCSKTCFADYCMVEQVEREQE